MMPKITSVFDLLNRLEKDKRYKNLLILACSWDIIDVVPSSASNRITLEVAKSWLDNWIDNDVNQFPHRNYTCDNIVDYLNSKRYLIDDSGIINFY